MGTLLKLGPANDGQEITWEEFESAGFEEGYRYEIIDGVLSVLPTPNIPHDFILVWLNRHLLRYADAHPDVINYVTGGARIFIPNRPRTTVPQPDLAAYRDFPQVWPIRDVHWRSLGPILVVEIVSEDTPDKDLVRNVGLYGAVPGIREYWILDGRTGILNLRVYRRRGLRWQNPIDVSAGGTYTTPRLLPGFSLAIDPLS
jgi:Uma2 family endonuclease